MQILLSVFLYEEFGFMHIKIQTWFPFLNQKFLDSSRLIVI